MCASSVTCCNACGPRTPFHRSKVSPSSVLSCLLFSGDCSAVSCTLRRPQTCCRNLTCPAWRAGNASRLLFSSSQADGKACSALRSIPPSPPNLVGLKLCSHVSATLLFFGVCPETGALNLVGCTASSSSCDIDRRLFPTGPHQRNAGLRLSDCVLTMSCKDARMFATSYKRRTRVFMCVEAAEDLSGFPATLAVSSSSSSSSLHSTSSC
mmetsp:Transcript_8774/g.22994  ORF Transcript_8774/g.22994 Transcript_8774/m.22994 type:complete len:210 (+) Transcript_8774:1290-1919(+)